MNPGTGGVDDARERVFGGFEFPRVREWTVDGFETERMRIMGVELESEGRGSGMEGRR